MCVEVVRVKERWMERTECSRRVRMGLLRHRWGERRGDANVTNALFLGMRIKGRACSVLFF